MTGLFLVAAVPVVLWIVQSVMLRRCGLPIRWRIDASNAPGQVRTVSRAATQLCLLAVVAIYPLAVGRPIVEYYREMLPVSAWRQLAEGVAAAVLFLCVLFIAWIATDALRPGVYRSRRRWRRRLMLLLPTSLFGAFVEEAIFRGVVLADLLESNLLPTVAAVGVGSLVFAAAHYVRQVKRYWTFPGHVMLGVLLCTAYVKTGTLWLPVGLHAGGIFVIMGTRPFVQYRGPAWLTGASVFPYAGVPGLVGLTILTIFTAAHYGAR